MQRRRLTILSLLHLVTDCYTMFAIAMWLPLQRTFGLDGGQTGLLLALGLIPANVLQPLYGAFSDRFDAKWLVVIGPLLMVVCYSLLGLSKAVPLTLFLLLVGAAGSGMFHPEATTLAGRFGATGSSKAMALFLTGGFIGQTIGPLWISWTITGADHGFEDSWRTIFPGLIIVAMGAAMVSRLPSEQPQQRAGWGRSLVNVLAGRQRAVWCLVMMNVMRWVGLMLIMSTLPLYLDQKYSPLEDAEMVQRHVGVWMSIFLAGQGTGILAGGLLSRAHRERVPLLVAFLISLLPAWLLPFVHGGVAMVMLFAAGLCVGWTIPLAIHLGQSILPGGERWISGMLIGFSWGVGSLLSPPLAGYLCETYSADKSLMSGALALTAALVLAVSLPRQSTLNRLKSQA